MAALVLGIQVRDPGGIPGRVEPARRLRLLARAGPGRDDSHPLMGFQLQRGDRPPPRDSLAVPGPVLVLTRGEPTAITLVNELAEPTGVHWHGLELESWSDGVAGWSGWGDRVAPAIAPGDSFVAHLTLPRAGTFIYHTHLNDVRQLTSGLYGALVVLEPGAAFDPATDHVFVLGWDGDGEPPRFVLNGDTAPPPLTIGAGVPQRLRLINIGPAAQPPLSLWRDGAPTRWRGLAKDGADLPAGQIGERPARQSVYVGETYDFAFTPRAGSYELRVGNPARPLIVQRLLAR
jgi:FtsP/CotA-like multicopper oxidase with cupredoxin domain